ncbi:shikimate kinase [Hydrogenothermus marinus]|uniref:Shikimate kinase n=1 Tax=Hydrogenothermus marinus TaxID=133270 RepID=A0A3M0BFC3_9AQUI|nr:shikimate kinase [Hydrogenothermus marinus]RMA96113.1 shikimate kinase [Hydrogenothermus marinus]
MNIYLIGFMGSGKSTVGKILAEKLNMQFIDLDEEIERRENKTIPEIFKEKGEKYFRNLEKNILKEFAKKDRLVIATGGGVGADEGNLKIMKNSGRVIWLNVSLEEVFKRCEGDTNRPLLNQPIENIKKLYENRKKLYSKADISINVDSKNPENIANEILKEL